MRLGVSDDAKDYQITHEYKSKFFAWSCKKIPKDLAKVNIEALSEAYQTLMDPQKRKQYDESLQEKLDSSWETIKTKEQTLKKIESGFVKIN